MRISVSDRGEHTWWTCGTTLEKMAGKGATENSSAADQLYPSLRQLPLLGVDYADLFRRVKVQEAVFQS